MCTLRTTLALKVATLKPEAGNTAKRPGVKQNDNHEKGSKIFTPFVKAISLAFSLPVGACLRKIAQNLCKDPWALRAVPADDGINRIRVTNVGYVRTLSLEALEALEALLHL